LAGCLEDRPRPAPPTLEITLSKDTVRSPDTLIVTVRVDDPDGIDSVWVSVDSVLRGDDAFFERTYQSAIRFTIRNGHVLGDQIPVRLQARDVVGFTGVLEKVVIVRGP
jgi:hypothetical protein